VHELSYHRDHAARWVLRLGDGTAESSRRAQDAVDTVWPLLAELFIPTDVELRLVAAGVAVDPAATRDEVTGVLTQVLERATLRTPARPADTPPRNRRGEHGPELAELLTDLQGLAREHPAATW
jgi:ring-1,2-phenylacetyl-CoA epoxidase subunit PaaC